MAAWSSGTLADGTYWILSIQNVWLFNTVASMIRLCGPSTSVSSSQMTRLFESDESGGFILKLMLSIKHCQVGLDSPVLTPTILIWVPGHRLINNLMTWKMVLTTKCKRKTRIWIGTVQCALIRGTISSYRIPTAYVWKPWASVLDLWVNVVHNYPSRICRRHYIAPPELEEEEETWLTLQVGSLLSREKQFNSLRDLVSLIQKWRGRAGGRWLHSMMFSVEPL